MRTVFLRELQRLHSGCTMVRNGAIPSHDSRCNYSSTSKYTLEMIPWVSIMSVGRNSAVRALLQRKLHVVHGSLQCTCLDFVEVGLCRLHMRQGSNYGDGFVRVVISS